MSDELAMKAGILILTIISEVAVILRGWLPQMREMHDHEDSF